MEYREELAQSFNRLAYHLTNKKYLAEISSTPQSLQNWKRMTKNHKFIKNKNVKAQIATVLENATKEAQKLGMSKVKKASISLSLEEFILFKEKQKKVERAKKMVFRYLQLILEKEFGKHAQTFILNNRFIKELVEGDFSRNLPYKKELIESYCRKLDLPLEEFVSINNQ